MKYFKSQSIECNFNTEQKLQYLYKEIRHNQQLSEP